ncbi:unnamed protein product [Thlaspi arvense]|uniref:Tr-type G domain-containing protein n=1 Tax=Thlaspi arvense TaxID=13288 RepID=A0AAU9R9X5_THLAR|nr:unnamed protein product [Thlaspi arvense]
MDRKKSSAWCGDEDHPLVSSFMGGEKSKNKSSVIEEEGYIGLELCKKPMQLEENHESSECNSEEIDFSGESKMKSKNRGSVGSTLLDVEDYKEEANDVTKSEEIGETSKSKKKKKNKSGRSAHEEEDLDKILAELGITPVEAQPETVTPADVAVEKDGEEETVESAAAKKRRKKKEKKAATSSVEAKEDNQENSISETSQPKKKDAKGKVAEKKVPKHVQEIQEIIARRKEAEERKRKEEEEKLRKEEEERRIQEEQERIAEEIRQRRKIRDKEKLQRKKQEGGILTEKQKRDEAFKNKALNEAESLLVADKNGDPTKRPIYANKRKPAPEKAIGSASVQVKDDVETKEKHADEPATLHEIGSADDGRIDRIEIVGTEEKQAAADIAEENGDEKDDWEARIGDSDYDDEEESQPVVKEELKDTVSKAHHSDPPTDRPTVKVGVPGKPTTLAKNSVCKVDDAAPPKDASKDSVVNGVTKEREENLRSPICCIMVMLIVVKQSCWTASEEQMFREAKLEVPGLLVIDTPGHESFTNLRSRGSNLCDLAILVVDIKDGLQPQTIESLNLLRRRNTEFIVALNKVDRLCGWKTCKNAPIRKAMEQQSRDVINEFNTSVTAVITQFKEQGLNTELYYKNREMGETFSIVPTSAISGEGSPDLLLLLVKWAQKTMVEKLTYVDKVQCTVLEVKVIEGHGTTIDVVLVNGVLHEGDQIVVCGSQASRNGPVVTTIRSLLTPTPMKELRVKGTYLHHREVKAAQCIKITAKGLEHAVAGTSLHVIGPDEDVEEAKKTVGTPICILKEIEKRRVFMDIGSIASIVNNKQPVDYAKKGENVAIKIIASNPGEQKMFGRHFGMDDELVSHISRRSIDILEANYRDELSEDEWELVSKLKEVFEIL